MACEQDLVGGGTRKAVGERTKWESVSEASPLTGFAHWLTCRDFAHGLRSCRNAREPVRRFIKEWIWIWSRIFPNLEEDRIKHFLLTELSNCFGDLWSWWIYKLRLFCNNCWPTQLSREKTDVISLVTYYTFHEISTFHVQQKKIAKSLRNFREISSKPRWDMDSHKSTFAPKRTFVDHRPRAKLQADLWGNVNIGKDFSKCSGKRYKQCDPTRKYTPFL